MSKRVKLMGGARMPLSARVMPSMSSLRVGFLEDMLSMWLADGTLGWWLLAFGGTVAAVAWRWPHSVHRLQSTVHSQAPTTHNGAIEGRDAAGLRVSDFFPPEAERLELIAQQVGQEKAASIRSLMQQPFASLLHDTPPLVQLYRTALEDRRGPRAMSRWLDIDPPAVPEFLSQLDYDRAQYESRQLHRFERSLARRRPVLADLERRPAPTVSVGRDAETLLIMGALPGSVIGAAWDLPEQGLGAALAWLLAGGIVFVLGTTDSRDGKNREPPHQRERDDLWEAQLERLSLRPVRALVLGETEHANALRDRLEAQPSRVLHAPGTGSDAPLAIAIRGFFSAAETPENLLAEFADSLELVVISRPGGPQDLGTRNQAPFLASLARWLGVAKQLVRPGGLVVLTLTAEHTSLVEPAWQLLRAPLSERVEFEGTQFSPLPVSLVPPNLDATHFAPTALMVRREGGQIHLPREERRHAIIEQWQREWGQRYGLQGAIRDWLNLWDAQGMLGREIVEVGSGAYAGTSDLQDKRIILIDLGAPTTVQGSPSRVVVRGDIQRPHEIISIERAAALLGVPPHAFQDLDQLLTRRKVDSVVMTQLLNYVSLEDVIRTVTWWLRPQGRLFLFDKPGRGYRRLFSTHGLHSHRQLERLLLHMPYVFEEFSPEDPTDERSKVQAVARYDPPAALPMLFLPPGSESMWAVSAVGLALGLFTIWLGWDLLTLPLGEGMAVARVRLRAVLRPLLLFMGAMMLVLPLQVWLGGLLLAPIWLGVGDSEGEGRPAEPLDATQPRPDTDQPTTPPAKPSTFRAGSPFTVTAETLRPYLLFHQYHGGPIQMLVDDFQQGTQVIVVGDPHSHYVSLGPSYAAWLRLLVQRFQREARGQKVFVELHPWVVEHKLIPLLQRAIDLGIEWPGKPSDFSQLGETDWRWQIYLNSNVPDWLLPMLRTAVERSMTIIGFDPRQDLSPHGAPVLPEHLPGLSTWASEWEEQFTRLIAPSLNPNDPEERALVIAGTSHVEKAEGLKMGGRVARIPGLKVKTVLVEIGWGDFNPGRFPDWQLRHLLRATGLSVVAIDQMTQPAVGSLQVYQDGLIPVLLSENFDRLIYFRDEQALFEYLTSDLAASPNHEKSHESGSASEGGGISESPMGGQWRVLRPAYWGVEKHVSQLFRNQGIGPRLGEWVGWALLPTLIESVGFVWYGSGWVSPLLSQGLAWAFGLQEAVGPPARLAAIVLLQLLWHLPHLSLRDFLRLRWGRTLTPELLKITKVVLPLGALTIVLSNWLSLTDWWLHGLLLFAISLPHLVVNTWQQRERRTIHTLVRQLIDSPVEARRLKAATSLTRHSNRPVVIRALADATIMLGDVVAQPRLSLLWTQDSSLLGAVLREQRHLRELAVITLERLGWGWGMHWQRVLDLNQLLAEASSSPVCRACYGTEVRWLLEEAARPRSPAHRWLIEWLMGRQVASNETALFRHLSQFQMLERIAPALLTEWIAQGMRGTIFSLGASTGREAASIAAIFLDQIKRHPEWHVSHRRVPVVVRGIEIQPDLVIDARRQLTEGFTPVDRLWWRSARLRGSYQDLPLALRELARIPEAALLTEEHLESIRLAASRLVNEALPQIRRLVRFQQASVVDPRVLKAIRRHGRVVFINSMLYQMPERAFRQLGQTLTQLGAGAYVFTTATRESAIELGLDLDRDFETLVENHDGVVLRKRDTESTRRSPGPSTHVVGIVMTALPGFTEVALLAVGVLWLGWWTGVIEQIVAVLRRAWSWVGRAGPRADREGISGLGHVELLSAAEFEEAIQEMKARLLTPGRVVYYERRASVGVGPLRGDGTLVRDQDGVLWVQDHFYDRRLRLDQVEATAFNPRPHRTRQAGGTEVAVLYRILSVDDQERFLQSLVRWQGLVSVGLSTLR